MGVDFVSILDHTNTDKNGLVSMPQRLDALVPVLEDISHYYRGWFPMPEPWEPWVVMKGAPPSVENPPYRLTGGAGFYISFGERSVYVHHITRFYNFISEEKPRQLLVQFCHEFGQIVQSRRAFYGSDGGGRTCDFVSDGMRLSDIERALLDEGYEKISPLESYCRQKKELWDACIYDRKLFCIEDI